MKTDQSYWPPAWVPPPPPAKPKSPAKPSRWLGLTIITVGVGCGWIVGYSQGAVFGFGFAIGVDLFLTLYLVPALIAFQRNISTRWLLLGVNLMFGWTLLGWLVSLMWALMG